MWGWKGILRRGCTSHWRRIERRDASTWRNAFPVDWPALCRRRGPRAQLGPGYLLPHRAPRHSNLGRRKREDGKTIYLGELYRTSPDNCPAGSRTTRLALGIPARRGWARLPFYLQHSDPEGDRRGLPDRSMRSPERNLIFTFGGRPATRTTPALCSAKRLLRFCILYPSAEKIDEKRQREKAKSCKGENNLIASLLYLYQ